jgi:hypothetical protein
MKFFCNGVRHLFDHVVVHGVSFLEIKTAGSVVTEPAVHDVVLLVKAGRSHP